MTIQQRWKYFVLTLLAFTTMLGLSVLSYGLSESFSKRDDVINAQVKALVAGDSALALLPVTITTNQGVVSIYGKVKTERQAMSLVTLAEQTSGVQSVDSSSLVLGKTGKNLDSDKLITSLVTGLFIREGFMGSNNVTGANFQVETRHGRVYLNGTVPNAQTLTTAVSLVRTLPGVSDVDVDHVVDQSKL